MLSQKIADAGIAPEGSEDIILSAIVNTGHPIVWLDFMFDLNFRYMYILNSSLNKHQKFLAILTGAPLAATTTLAL